MKHKHHIIPRHMGGTDDESNITHLTVDEHAEAHLALYLEHGKWQDWCAYRALSGQMDVSEASRIAWMDGARRGGITQGNKPENIAMLRSVERDRTKWTQQARDNHSDCGRRMIGQARAREMARRRERGDRIRQCIDELKEGGYNYVMMTSIINAPQQNIAYYGRTLT